MRGSDLTGAVVGMSRYKSTEADAGVCIRVNMACGDDETAQTCIVLM